MVNFLCGPYKLYTHFILIFLVFLVGLIFMTFQKFNLTRIFLGSFLMTIVTIGIREIIVPWLFFGLSILAIIFGIRVDYPLSLEAPIIDFLKMYFVLNCALIVPSLLIQLWIPFYLFPEISLKKILIWLIISISIVAFIFSITELLCPSILIGI